MNFPFPHFINSTRLHKADAYQAQTLAGRWIVGAILVVFFMSLTTSTLFSVSAQDLDNFKRQASPAIWKMTDEDSEVWLLGTYHILPPNVNWRSSAVMSGIEDAQSIYLEADIDSQVAQMNMIRAMMLNGFQKKGRKLSDKLTKSQLKQLKAIADEINIPFKALDDMRPWNAYLTISVQFIVSKGYDPQGGVDASISKQARAEKIPLKYFETAEQQISFFADLPEELELSLLTATLADWEKLNTEFDFLFDAWADGNIAAMDELINESLKKTSPELYDVILVKRNKDWISSIDRLMGEDGKHLIAVGAGHLVGDDSVVHLLRKKGYKIERVTQ